MRQDAWSSVEQLLTKVTLQISSCIGRTSYRSKFTTSLEVSILTNKQVPAFQWTDQRPNHKFLNGVFFSADTRLLLE